MKGFKCRWKIEGFTPEEELISIGKSKSFANKDSLVFQYIQIVNDLIFHDLFT